MSEKIVCNLTFDEIKELIDIVSEKKIGKIDLKDQDSHLVIEDKKSQVISAPQQYTSIPETIYSSDTPAQSKKKEELSGNVVKAPIVGTYYASSSPDKPPFVKVGQKVRKGDVLFIIESMKLMNEIQSDFDGVVSTIFVSNATAVEFDQPILIIE